LLHHVKDCSWAGVSLDLTAARRSFHSPKTVCGSEHVSSLEFSFAALTSDLSFVLRKAFPIVKDYLKVSSPFLPATPIWQPLVIHSSEAHPCEMCRNACFDFILESNSFYTPYISSKLFPCGLLQRKPLVCPVPPRVPQQDQCSAPHHGQPAYPFQISSPFRSPSPRESPDSFLLSLPSRSRVWFLLLFPFPVSERCLQAVRIALHSLELRGALILDPWIDSPFCFL